MFEDYILECVANLKARGGQVGKGLEGIAEGRGEIMTSGEALKDEGIYL